MRKMQDLGLNCLVAPEKYTGMHFDNVTISMIVEELSRGCAGMTLAILANCLASEPVLIAGNEEQQDWWFTRACEEENSRLLDSRSPVPIGCFRIATTARKDGDYYILNGTKFYHQWRVAVSM